MDRLHSIGSLFYELGKFENPLGKLPPVNQWHPDLSGNMDMHIHSNGDWVHEGEIIKRDKLSRLFSSILKKESEEYYLVTPVEKWRISVEDQPFVIVLMHAEAGSIELITNMGETVLVGEGHGLISDKDHEAPRVHVRNNLYARLNRNVFYQMAEIANETEDGYFIYSEGVKFKIG